MRVLVKSIDGPPVAKQQSVSEEQAAFGRRLAQVRESAGIKQEEWADMLGRSSQAVSAWEVGRNVPAVDIIMQYEQRLGVDLHWLLTGRHFSEQVSAVQALIKVLEVGSAP